MIMHEDYDPTYAAFSWNGFAGVMKAVATFDINGEKKEVVLEVNPDDVIELESASKDVENPSRYAEVIKKIGITKNELPADQINNAFYADADNPSNMSKFQINSESAEMFLDMARAVYGYDCYLEKNVSMNEKGDSSLKSFTARLGVDEEEKQELSYYTDFVIVKNDDGEGFPPVRVHYRSMSDGERKIATMLKQLLTPSQYNCFDIFLIDNIEMHIYMKRHKNLINKIFDHFGNKQIIATTHSPILVGTDDIKPYLEEKHLFDVTEIRKNTNALG
jgi:predicted ATPase